MDIIKACFVLST